MAKYVIMGRPEQMYQQSQCSEYEQEENLAWR